MESLASVRLFFCPFEERRHVNPIVATLLTQHHIFYDRAIIIVSSHPDLASQDNERLILRGMLMYRYFRARLHSV